MTRTIRWLSGSILASVVLMGCGGSSPATAVGIKPAGADKTQITNWTDPRPAVWTNTYPLFGPIATGDGSLKRAQDAGQLRVCAELDIAPFQYTNAQGQVLGFEVDMFDYVAKVLGIAKVVHVNIDWTSGIAAVQAGKCDIFADAIAIRSDRAEAPGIKWTVPYSILYDVMVVRKDSGITSVDQLKGKTIAVTAPSTDELTLNSLIASQLGGPSVTHTEGFTNPNSCYLAASNKTVQACFSGQSETVSALLQYTDLKTLTGAYTYVPLTSDEFKLNPYMSGVLGGVMPGADGDLNLAISIAIEQWIKTGTQQTVLTKYGLNSPEQAKLVRVDANLFGK